MLFLLVSLVAWIQVGLSLPHLQKAFKCAGDNGQVCETGLCYDALGFYESGQNVGCAQKEMCTSVGCFMYKNVFTCCCGNRYCNGKTEMLMLAKFEMFKKNKGWPTFLPPRIFARNITISTSNRDQTAEPPDVRMAPPRQSTTLVEPTKLPTQRTTKFVAESTEKPDKITTSVNEHLIHTSTSSSTTTKIANLPPDKPHPRPLIIEQEIKLPSSNQKQPDLAAEKDSERTTRSSSAQTQGTSTAQSTTTTQKQRPAKERPTTERPKIEKITATNREQAHPKSFPWYYVTIVGFVIASIIGALGYLGYKKFKQWKLKGGRSSPADSADSIRNASSVDSSRISAEAYPNDAGQRTADPLLAVAEARR